MENFRENAHKKNRKKNLLRGFDLFTMKSADILRGKFEHFISKANEKNELSTLLSAIGN